MNKNPLIVALDVDNEIQVLDLVEELGQSINFYKVGLQLFLSEGEKILKILHALNKNIFLDLKLFDIPNTVYKATLQALRWQPEFFTLHCLGGTQMLEEAVRANDELGSKTKLLGVTMLTSMEANDLNISDTSEFVKTMSKQALNTGLDGIICSPEDVKNLRMFLPNEFLIVCPGIRLSQSGDDQKRVGTPSQALSDGADFLVVGRPVTEAVNKVDAVNKFLSI